MAIRRIESEWSRILAGPAGRWMAVALVLALLPWPGYAVALGQQAAETLRIEVIEGEGSINNIRELSMRSPAVRVLDAAGKPVPGASVTFITPSMGASAIFADGSNQATVFSDARGVARVEGMKPNNIVGNFEIRVVASIRGQRANARLTQTNAAPAVGTGGGSGKGLIIVLVLAGVGGGLAAALAGGGGNGGGGVVNPPPGGGANPPSTPTPVTITPGAPVFGAP